MTFFRTLDKLWVLEHPTLRNLGQFGAIMQITCQKKRRYLSNIFFCLTAKSELESKSWRPLNHPFELPGHIRQSIS